MLSTPLQHERGACYAVGIDYLVLAEDYDPRQEWFPFVRAFLIRNKIRERKNPTPMSKRQIKYALESHGVRMPPHARDLYHYQRDVPQYVLPFPCHKQVWLGEEQRLESADYPAWDRDADGNLLKVQIRKPKPQTNVEAWCRKNFWHRFQYSKRSVICERESDAENLIRYLKDNSRLPE